MTDSAKEAALASLNSNVKCILDSLTITLREKNKRYGNSALEPANIFGCIAVTSSGMVKWSSFARGKDIDYLTLFE